MIKRHAKLKWMDLVIYKHQQKQGNLIIFSTSILANQITQVNVTIINAIGVILADLAQ